MKNDKGFTLVEIIVVVSVLVIIAGLFALNAINTLKNNKNTEEESIVAQIKSAADAYVSTNPEQVERLYNGYGYVDIPIGELRDNGLLSEDLKDAETGVRVPDDDVVRVKLDIGDYFNYTYPLTEAEQNAQAWTMVAEDLTIEYDPTSDMKTWCSDNQNVFKGLYDNRYTDKANYAKVTSKLYLMDNSSEGLMFDGDYFGEAYLKSTSCNVNPKMSGTYNITYTFVDPSLGMEKTFIRTVYVATSGNDVISFTAVINDNRKIMVGATDVPIVITETYKDGSTATFESSTDSLNAIKYSIEKFDTSKVGDFKALVSALKTNSDGSVPTPQQPDYYVTDSFGDLIGDSPDCTPSKRDPNICYFKGEQDGNYVNYYGKIFRIYYVNKSSNAIRIVYDGDYVQAPYGQLGECISTSCCNQGRYAYIALGDLTQGVNKAMDAYLNDFYNALNGGKTLLYLNSQSFTTYYNVQDYSSRAKNNYYNGLSLATNIMSGAIKTKIMSTKIALLSREDYMEIAECTDDNICKYARNYLSGQSKFWLLDFYAARFGVGAHNRGVNVAEIFDYAVDVNGTITYDGAVKEQNQTTSQIATTSLGVRPTVELGNSKISGGTGTKDEPYIIKVN